jgi:hypothetical protein
VGRGTVTKVSKRPTVRATVRAGSFPLVSTAGIVFIIFDSVKLHILHHLIGGDSAGVAALSLAVLIVVWVMGFSRWIRRNDL